MALTEIQQMGKTDFYNRLQTSATKINSLMGYLEDIAEFIGFVDTAELDRMNVPAGDIRSDLVEYRTVMNELIAFFKGTSTTQTYVPANVTDRIRSM